MEIKDFEASLARLEQIVDQLEKGDQTLEASLKLFEDGMKMAEFCSKKLEEAERKVQILVKDQGKIKEVDFEEPAGD